MTNREWENAKSRNCGIEGLRSDPPWEMKAKELKRKAQAKKINDAAAG
jgi:hypothetical protein